MRAIPVETRLAAVAAVDVEGLTIRVAADRFGISEPSLKRFLRKHRLQESMKPGLPPGPSLKLNEAQQQVLADLVRENPQRSARQLRELLLERTGCSLCENTLRRYLHRAGLRHVRPVVVATKRPPVDTQTRYRPIHRRDPAAGYPSDLTEEEWALLAPLFDRTGQRGRPPKYERRRILDAIFYVVRTGCAWRMLPLDFPPWQNVYGHFRRWAESGLFEEMHDLLRRRWREREGKSPEPSAGIVDSQSVKSTEKGDLEATTGPRRWPGASATSS